jgi:hypothetical protein
MPTPPPPPRPPNSPHNSLPANHQPAGATAHGSLPFIRRILGLTRPRGGSNGRGVTW